MEVEDEDEDRGVDEERREPDTGQIFTFREFLRVYASEFSREDIDAYWRDACERVAPSAAP